MNVVLWVVQGFLAAAFLYSGICKSVLGRERLVSIGQTGVAGLSYPAIRTIGALEILGAAGILLPWATRILPVLTPLAAVCFAAIMVPAARIHLRRGEPRSVGVNVLFFFLSMFVAYARFRSLPA